MNERYTLKSIILEESFILEAYNTFKKETNWISHLGLESFCFAIEENPVILKDLFLCQGTDNPIDTLSFVTQLKPSVEFIKALEDANPLNKKEFCNIDVEITAKDCRDVIILLEKKGFKKFANVLSIAAIEKVLFIQPWILIDVKNNTFQSKKDAVIFLEWTLDILIGDMVDNFNETNTIEILKKEISAKYCDFSIA